MPTLTTTPTTTFTPDPHQIAVEYRDVTFYYPSADTENGARKPAIQSITFAVHEGERLGILGPNGGGKSTLIKLTLGLLDGAAGDIRVLGRTPHQARRDGLVGYVAQRIGAELAFPLSVRQVVAMAAMRGLAPWKSLPPDRARHVNHMLELVGMDTLADRPIGKLSGGQLQRVTIARALAAQPRLLLLDEPTVGIDVAGQQRFASLLNRVRDELGLTIIIVSHDIRAIAGSCDRVACLSRTLHFHDAPQGLTPAVLAEVFRHDVSGIFGDVHIDAHAASTCTDPSHSHAHHPPAPGPIGLSISALPATAKSTTKDASHPDHPGGKS
ncbi:MAG: metal ABC transporter ATP-binding protein [Phycisphaerales bacterium]|nr:metal ABC transporter ATP-binding protein [Phycisphaerales bacterium]